MNKKNVISAVKVIKDECASSSCDDCVFCTKGGECKLAEELIGVPSKIKIEELEEVKGGGER